MQVSIALEDQADLNPPIRQQEDNAPGVVTVVKEHQVRLAAKPVTTRLTLAPLAWLTVLLADPDTTVFLMV